MTKNEAIQNILSGHSVTVKFDCDLNEEADDIFINALEKIRDWADEIDKELENEVQS